MHSYIPMINIILVTWIIEVRIIKGRLYRAVDCIELAKL